MVKFFKNNSVFWGFVSKKELQKIYSRHSCGIIVHPFQKDSCVASAGSVWKDSFKYSFLINLPMLAHAFIIERSLNPLYDTLTRSAFLATLASCMLPISCVMRLITGTFHPLQVV